MKERISIRGHIYFDYLTYRNGCRQTFSRKRGGERKKDNGAMEKENEIPNALQQFHGRKSRQEKINPPIYPNGFCQTAQNDMRWILMLTNA
jgi:hypothetical protein